LLWTGDKAAASGGASTGQQEYVTMWVRANDVKSGQEDGEFFFTQMLAGTQRTFFSSQSSGGSGYITFNEDGQDVDTRIEAASGSTVAGAPANAFRLMGNDGKIGVGTGAPSANLHIVSGASGSDLFKVESNLGEHFTISRDIGVIEGPHLVLNGENPSFDIQDDTGPKTYFTRLAQSGNSLYVTSEDDDPSEVEIFRLSPDYVAIQRSISPRVGIGTTGTANVALHLLDDSTADMVLLENSDAGTGSAPDLNLYRNSTSPATDDDLGHILFSGNDSDGTDSKVNYFQIKAVIRDSTKESVDGDLIFIGPSNSSDIEVLRLGRTDGVVVNEGGTGSVDFRCESTGNANMILVDAANDNVGVGITPGAQIHAMDISATGSVADDNPVVRISGYYSGGEICALELANFNNDANSDVKMRMTSGAGTNSDFEIIHDSFGGTQFLTNQPHTATVEQLRLSLTSVTVNNGQVDHDFIVKSDGNATMLYVDGGDDSIGVGAAPTASKAKLQVDEDATFLRYVDTLYTEDHTVTAQQMHGGVMIMKASGAANTFTLPTAVVGMHASFICMDVTNGMVIARGGSDTINNGLTATTEVTAIGTRIDLLCITSTQWIASTPGVTP